MVDVTVEGLDMTYKVGQATAKARLDAWMTPAHERMILVHAACGALQ